jgi:Zn finger protein HypA/HybF involved in hydrogenase expression
MNDDACPTCGSKNFQILETSETEIQKSQCNNCKKFWFK